MNKFRVFTWDYGPLIVIAWFMISFVFRLVTDDTYWLISIFIAFLYLFYCYYLDRKYLTRTQVIRGYIHKPNER